MENARKTVAIVDDEPIARMDLCDMLSEQDFVVTGLTPWRFAAKNVRMLF